MKCWTVDGQGLATLKLAERENPKISAARDVLVHVHAVSLNYRDLMVADGRYGGHEDPPIVACSDMAGVVVDVGSEVSELKPGDRVLNSPFRFWPAGTLRSEWARTFVGGKGLDGVLAESITYPAESLVKVPDHFTWQEAATLTIAGLTAWAAVVTHGHTKPGDWVLIHGTGGVAIFAAQIAKFLGARTIISTSSDRKGELVKEKFGVDSVIDYRDPDWPEQVRKITGGGVNTVVETVGGASLGMSIKACTYGGRVAVIGVLGGVESDVNIRDFLYHQVSVRGIFMESTDELRALAKAFEDREERPYVDRAFSFEEVPDAYEYLRTQQHIGKVVINVR